MQFIIVLEVIVCGTNRDTTMGLRDAALILLGFAGAFRRSELVSLDLTGLSPTHGTIGTMSPSEPERARAIIEKGDPL